MAGQVLGKVTAGGGTHLISNTFYGTCATAAGTAAKIVKLVDTNTDAFSAIAGMLLAVKFTNTNSVANPTLTLQTYGAVTLLDAKNIYRYGTTAPSTSSTSSWKAGSVVLLVYDGLAWQMCGWLNDDTLYTNNASLGTGFANQTNITSATAIKADFVNGTYTLVANGVVGVIFTYDVLANSTLNIKAKGAKPIYYQGAAITEGVIKAGDTATFIYDGTNYNLISIDRVEIPEEVIISDTEPDPTDTNTKIWVQL